MASIYITTCRECGELVAEVDGVKCYELTDCIHDLGYGFRDSFEVDFDMNDPHNDVWGLIEEIYETAAVTRSPSSMMGLRQRTSCT